jgi:hypothetical protein
MDAYNPFLDFDEVDDDIPPYGDPLIQVKTLGLGP